MDKKKKLTKILSGIVIGILVVALILPTVYSVVIMIKG